MEILALPKTDGEEEASEDPDSLLDANAPFSVLVLYSLVEQISHGEKEDILADLETPHTAQSIVHGLTRRGYCVDAAPVRDEDGLRAALQGYSADATLVFNLCECLGGEARGEARVPAVLEELGFAYVGAPDETLFNCLNKDVAKAYLLRSGLPTAPYQVFYTGRESVHVALPAIVKPTAEDGSLGITPHSVVDTERALKAQVRYVLETYRQPALVETFLNGREFSVSLWGNDALRLLSVSEMDFSACSDPEQRILTFSEKWTTAEQFPALDPAPLTAARRAEIFAIAARAYRALNCRDYARVDLREHNGQLYVLEVNPNPCLAEDSGFARAANTAGLDYAHLVDGLVRLAWQRTAMNQRDRDAAMAESQVPAAMRLSIESAPLIGDQNAFYQEIEVPFEIGEASEALHACTVVSD